MISSKVISTSATKFVIYKEEWRKMLFETRMTDVSNSRVNKDQEKKRQVATTLKSPNLKWQIHTLCIWQIHTAKNKSPNLKWQIHTLCIWQIHTAKKNLQTWSDKYTLCVFDKYTPQKNTSNLFNFKQNKKMRHCLSRTILWDYKPQKVFKPQIQVLFLILVWPCLESRTRAASTAIQGFYFYVWSTSYMYYIYK